MIVPNTEENRKKCLCPKCPSYPSHCQGEILYCGSRESDCDIDAKGCICTGCLVYYDYGLNGLYYCDKVKSGEAGSFIRKKRKSEDENFYQTILDIKDAAALGKHKVSSMGSPKKMPFSFNDLHFVPAQVYNIPLNAEEKVSSEIVIGPEAKRSLKLAFPIIISGMSYGAVSKKVRLIISRVSAKLKIGFNSGEGGLMEDEIKTGAKYMIGQYATGRFGITEEKLKQVGAVEIRFGQGAYPGKGSYLPSHKITEDIARARSLKEGEPANSPAHHPDITTPRELEEKIRDLRNLTGGVPIGAKIGAGNIEKDAKILVDAGVDFIAVDGFGGGTGATDAYVRDNVGLPILAALPRAARALEKLGAKNKVSLIAGGGLRSSADYAKCLALGANAVYIGTAALIAIGCEQYKICHTGLCPTGITTHDPMLLKQLDEEKGMEKLYNFIKVSAEEIEGLTRIAGKSNISELNKDDLVSLDKSLAELTGLRWLNGKIQ